MIAPDKHSIYPEYLPDGLTPLGPATRLDQLLAPLRDHSAVAPLDLRGPEFLSLYAALFVLVCLTALLLRWLLRGPGGDPPPEAADLDDGGLAGVEAFEVVEGAHGPADAGLRDVEATSSLGRSGAR